MIIYPTWKQIELMLLDMTDLELELLQEYMNREFHRRENNE